MADFSQACDYAMLHIGSNEQLADENGNEGPCQIQNTQNTELSYESL